MPCASNRKTYGNGKADQKSAHHNLAAPQPMVAAPIEDCLKIARADLADWPVKKGSAPTMG